MNSSNKSLPKVVLTHPLIPDVIQAELGNRARVVVATTPAALKRELRDADGLISLLSDRINESFLSQAPKLRALANFAVGVNNFDFNACKARGIRVANTPGVLTRATAELTLALLFAAAKRVPEGERLCRTGRWKGWQPDELLGLQLRGRQAVIVGKGRIGSEVARMMRAFGIRTSFIGRDATRSEIGQALKRAQILSLHLPLTPKTHHWLDERRLALLPPDAIVLNTARGPVVDEKALTRALQKRRIFAAGLDVYEAEPQIPGALRRLSNVVLLPHLGSATDQTRTAMARLAARGLWGLLSGKAIPNEVMS